MYARAAVPTRAAFASSMNVLNEIAGNGNHRRIGYGPFHRRWIRREPAQDPGRAVPIRRISAVSDTQLSFGGGSAHP
jgi:hypothetical protein